MFIYIFNKPDITKKEVEEFLIKSRVDDVERAIRAAKMGFDQYKEVGFYIRQAQNCMWGYGGYSYYNFLYRNSTAYEPIFYTDNLIGIIK